MALLQYSIMTVVYFWFYWKVVLSNSTAASRSYLPKEEINKSLNSSYEMETTDYEEYTPECRNGDTYASLEECVKECRQIHEKRFDSNKPAFNSSGKMRFKVVELEEFEYKISSGYLHTNLPLVKLPLDTFSIKNKIVHVCYPLEEHFVQCKKWYLFDDEYEFINKSFIWVPLYHQVYPVGEFYIDFEVNEALVCKNVEIQEAPSATIMFVTAYSISAISLLVTFILSLLIPELNIRNNKILMCHMIILSLAYWVLVTRFALRNTKITTRICLLIAILNQFCFLGSFFWINVQAIDLFIRFINLRGTKNKRSETLKFTIYSLYAWGCPFIICAITLAMEKSDSTVLRPNFREVCWFSEGDKLAAFVYFFLPIALILFANIALFILTIVKLYTVGKNANKVNKKIHTQLLQLYLKLVVVMGLCWIMEVVSWAVGGDERNWYFTDLINALQGLFIFIIYICKPSYIRRIIYQKNFFPNRPSWWPWKRNEMENNMERKTEHGTLSTTTSLNGTEVQTNAL